MPAFDPFVVPANLAGMRQSRTANEIAPQPTGGMTDLLGIGGLGHTATPAGQPRDLTAFLVSSTPPWLLVAQAQAQSKNAALNKAPALPSSPPVDAPQPASSSNIIDDLLYLDLGTVSAAPAVQSAAAASSAPQVDLLRGPLPSESPSGTGEVTAATDDAAAAPSSTAEVDPEVQKANIEKAHKLLGVTGLEKALTTVLVRMSPKKKGKKYLQCAPGKKLIIIGQVCLSYNLTLPLDPSGLIRSSRQY